MSLPLRHSRAVTVKAFEVQVPARQEDLATALLWECGTSGIEVRRAPRGKVALLAYFAGRRGLAGQLRARLRGVRGLDIRAVRVPRVDWVARFREGFRPLAAGNFTIVPSWLARARPAAKDGARRLVVEPGRAFGTGTHASTRLCLQALEQLARESPLGRVADLGTGTGLLSIAALLLGARSAAGVENDPEALVSARVHTRLNRSRVGLVRGDLAGPLRPRRFDTVLANLIAPMLHHRAAEILALGAPGARFVFAGILSDNLPLLRRTYRGKGRLSVLREGEWAALVLRTGRA